MHFWRKIEKKRRERGSAKTSLVIIFSFDVVLVVVDCKRALMHTHTLLLLLFFSRSDMHEQSLWWWRLLPMRRHEQINTYTNIKRKPKQHIKKNFVDKMSQRDGEFSLSLLIFFRVVLDIWHLANGFWRCCYFIVAH